MITAQDKTREIENRLIGLQHQIDEYEKTKDKDLKAKIISELDVAIPLMQGVSAYLDREVQRTDLDLLEKFMFTAAKDDVQILIKQLTEVEKKVKAE